jgi:hypothetical protein
MPLLHIALQDGFFHDTVVIRVNGREIFRKHDVTTKFQIGLADTVEVDLKEHSASLLIALPSKDIIQAVTVELAKPVYLGVSLSEDNTIRTKTSDTPFGYV